MRSASPDVSSVFDTSANDASWVTTTSDHDTAPPAATVRQPTILTRQQIRQARLILVPTYINTSLTIRNREQKHSVFAYRSPTTKSAQAKRPCPSPNSNNDRCPANPRASSACRVPCPPLRLRLSKRKWKRLLRRGVDETQ